MSTQAKGRSEASNKLKKPVETTPAKNALIMIYHGAYGNAKKKQKLTYSVWLIDRQTNKIISVHMQHTN